ncbi:MAG TPA: pitrilysin family protein [Allosphingosinicella sp.]|nr:pitrilysin family protein [Allosphingosinicella sp.]
MRTKFIAAAMLGLTLAGCATAPAGRTALGQGRAGVASGLQIESQYYRLPNGLKVVLSPDPSVPTATVGVYYGIGFRIEPRNRTGFAHLFEHLMFQGSANAPKGTFDDIIYSSGGINNGSTRFDYTNYYEVVPSNALESVLWVEADRMRMPVIDKTVLENQQGVVANEVKVNVLNQPYGGWPWIDMPMLANENWHNAHNFYGDLGDLQAATVEDAKDFFQSFYRPNNAVLVVAGDFDPAQARSWIERYFGTVPKGPPVKLPDISEPRQTQEKFRIRTDPLAPRPAFTAAWHVPKRGTPEWYAMGLLDQILVQGQDSRLHKALVRERGITSGIQGGMNIGLGNMYNYNGPMLWTVAFVHDPAKTREEITSALNAVIEDVRTNRVSAEELERARTKIRSNLYNLADPSTRFGLIDLLAVGALWENDPNWVNGLEAGFKRVTPELLLATAREYLRPTNRSILLVQPGAAPGAPTASKSGASQ